jgi:hypothetical protein
MTQRDNILQELNEIGGTLENGTPQNVYVVPAGFFETFSDQVLARINSPLSNDALKKDPYSIPDNYFDGLEERLMQAIRENADYQTAKEELESISPFLNGLKKETPYNVPQGYFENLSAAINKPKAKVISITHRRWFRYAAAAVIVGIIITSVFLVQGKKSSIDPNKNPAGWVAKNVKATPDQLDEFINLADEEATKNSVANKFEKPEEIKELIKDVSDKEIQDFLKETSVLDDNTSSLN